MHSPPPRNIGPYNGQISPAFDSPEFLALVSALPERIEAADSVPLASGRNRIVHCAIPAAAPAERMVVKTFPPPSALKDRFDRLRGSKARRAWLAADFLHKRGIGVPEPVAYLERRDGRRLLDSHYLSVYEPGLVSFREELIRLFGSDPDCATFMRLLQTVADAVRSLHDAGFLHNDLGNQNILLEPAGGRNWKRTLFVDLNRSRQQDSPLAIRQRARDLSRIYLPSDLLRVFLDMYMGDRPSRMLLRQESRQRFLYRLWTASRPVRHPLRKRTSRRKSAAAECPPQAEYPPETDMWIWDERSAQAIGVLSGKDRKKTMSLSRHLAIAGPFLKGLPSVWREYGNLRMQCWQQPVQIRQGAGMAVQARPETWEREKALLQALGKIPVFVRFHAHEGPAQWDFAAEALRELQQEGHSVGLGLAQDRASVVDPSLWRRFVEHVLETEAASRADHVEIGHAINRRKWGVHSVAEYRRLLETVADLARTRPGLKFTGPAAIDFEYPMLMAALRACPGSLRFHALSHHLYVDRRGAPENRQGPFAALEKFALARAIARWAPACADRLIVSEVNWPLRGTGVHSPVGAPYESPWPRRNDPSVGEDEYADYMIRYLVTALCSGMVERVYWWRLVARGFGLVDDTDSARWRKRPAYRMLRVFLDLLGASRFECTQTIQLDPADPAGSSSAQGRWLKFRRADGQEIVLAYAWAGSGAWTPPFPCGRVLDGLGREQPVEPTVALGSRPVYLFKT